MGRILEIVGRFLEEDDWPFNLIEGRLRFIRPAFEGKNGQFTCYAQERTEQQQFVFYAIFPVRAPDNRLADVGRIYHARRLPG